MVLLHQKQDTVRAHSKKSRKKDDFYLTIPNKCSIFAVPVRGRRDELLNLLVYIRSPRLCRIHSPTGIFWTGKTLSGGTRNSTERGHEKPWSSHATQRLQGAMANMKSWNTSAGWVENCCRQHRTCLRQARQLPFGQERRMWIVCGSSEFCLNSYDF